MTEPRFEHPKIKPTREENVERLREMLEVVEALRAPDGCPWDGEQTHASLRPYLLEETYELLEAIEAGATADVSEELGDVLLQVFMHHAIAQEAGEFSIAEVAAHATAKMVHRHPHVFGDVEVSGAEEVLTNWEGLKQKELRKRGRVSALEGAPKSLPALAWALSLQKRAARVGFDWKDADGVLEKVAEEARELADAAEPQRREEELGDLLFAIVNLARHLKINPEDALRGSARRFYGRFEKVEEGARAAGTDVRDLDAEALDRLWEEAKAGA
ncbi:MAG: tetrapyrrole methylase family protein / MazG family protein [Chloroflexota bacterium]|jgi:tetrapyrrole methylase family protein/MazG family protein|nr:tetrapyrrole methylase family protein / MazG family protein [Chloroflexota bacterium]